MNLIVDIGNSRIKVARSESGKISEVSFVENLTDLDELIQKADATIISSVRKLSDFNNKKVVVLSPTTSVPIQNNYSSPNTLGMDRLAGVVGCNYLYPNTNCLLIDCGTCITYDFIDSTGTYQGGSISPGLTMKFKALNNFTNSLPLVEGKSDSELIGKTTEESILSGVLNGTIAEMDQIMEEYKAHHSGLKVILTGGDGQFFESKLKATIFAQPKIVLIGLNRILEYNVEKA